MFESIIKFFNKIKNKENKENTSTSKDAAKERLHLVLMQDRANVSADFLELMKQEIIDVIKKYIDVDEEAIDVRLTNKENADGTNGAPALYANIPIINIKNDVRKMEKTEKETNKEKKEAETNQEEKEKLTEIKKDDKASENEQEGKENKADSDNKDDVAEKKKDDDAEENKEDKEGINKIPDEKNQEKKKSQNKQNSNKSNDKK